MRPTRLLSLVPLLCACSSEPTTEQRSAIAHGRDLFASTGTSPSKLNVVSCATCHAATVSSSDARILPGHPLAGATERPSFWGGQHVDLLVAINECRTYFMGASVRWTADNEQARAMFAYLSSLPPTHTAALPLTIVNVAADLPPGDPERGRVAFDASCRSCHGAARTGEGALKQGIAVLPGEPAEYFRKEYGFGDREVRIAFIEKVRHGPFLGLSGSMPPYSREALGDEDLSAILSYLGLAR